MQFALNIHTNVWNILRYLLFTLLLLPLAETLWARSHALSSGSRVLKGRTVRLRRSKLAYWGLHQEIDENSKMSKIFAVLLCVLHVAGTLLLEFGSESTEGKTFHSNLLSPSMISHGRAGSNSVSYFNAGMMLGTDISGSKKCIDGRPRQPKSFGLIYTKVQNGRVFNISVLGKPPEKKHEVIRFGMVNSGHYLILRDDGKSRWYFRENPKNAVPGLLEFALFVNDTTTCYSKNIWTFTPSIVCENLGARLDDKRSFEHALAITGLNQLTDSILARYSRRALKLSVDVTNLHISAHNTEVNSEFSTWIKSGMPLRKIPRMRTQGIEIFLRSTPFLRSDCNHEKAVEVSFLRGLKISNMNFNVSYVKRDWQSNSHDIIWIVGKKIYMAILIQKDNETCMHSGVATFCLVREKRKRHRLTYLYEELLPNRSSLFTEVWSMSVHGLEESALVDVVVQMAVEQWRGRIIDAFNSALEIMWHSKKFIEDGMLIRGVVRVTGTGVPGRSVKYRQDFATINMFGLAGLIVLMLLLPIPIALICMLRGKPIVDIETSYKRAVLEHQGSEDCITTPSKPPDVLVAEIIPGKVYQLHHTYLPQKGHAVQMSQLGFTTLPARAPP